MAGFIGGRTSAFDYIGPDLPNNPQNGEMWFDTDGASDGSGEVKVYDGADDAWEATGFTSHADLTDVTRSAHHPPVEVSGPLTQPSDQTVGLSIGDGLTTASGALVAALGDGLGVDGSGQVSIPSSAVSQSKLGFDTATQSELESHAGDGAAHHSRYTDQEAKDAAEVPSGVITMWSGTASDVPSGWTLCDGSDGTPDLRGRFIVGAGGSYAADDTGGADSVTLSESEMPSHDHTGSTTTDGSHTHSYEADAAYTNDIGTISHTYGGSDTVTESVDYAGDHNHSLSIDNAGGDSAHENRPPFYALAFIMKT